MKRATQCMLCSSLNGSIVNVSNRFRKRWPLPINIYTLFLSNCLVQPISPQARRIKARIWGVNYRFRFHLKHFSSSTLTSPNSMMLKTSLSFVNDCIYSVHADIVKQKSEDRTMATWFGSLFTTAWNSSVLFLLDRLWLTYASSVWPLILYGISYKITFIYMFLVLVRARPVHVFRLMIVRVVYIASWIYCCT